MRRRWKELIDDKRADQDRAACFRLTLVAGMKDKFVPQESSLNPFPFDEKEIGPGNHTQMVKPAEVGALPIFDIEEAIASARAYVRRAQAYCRRKRKIFKRD